MVINIYVVGRKAYLCVWAWVCVQMCVGVCVCRCAFVCLEVTGVFLACQLWSLKTLADATKQTAERQHIVLQVGVWLCVCVCVCVWVYHNNNVKMSQQSPYCLLISSHPFPAWHHQADTLPCAFKRTHLSLDDTCIRMCLPSCVCVCVCVWFCLRVWSHAVQWRRCTCFMCRNALIISQSLTGPSAPDINTYTPTHTHTHTLMNN